jgi:hypothetical protein
MGQSPDGIIISDSGDLRFADNWNNARGLYLLLRSAHPDSQEVGKPSIRGVIAFWNDLHTNLSGYLDELTTRAGTLLDPAGPWQGEAADTFRKLTSSVIDYGSSILPTINQPSPEWRPVAAGVHPEDRTFVMASSSISAITGYVQDSLNSSPYTNGGIPWTEKTAMNFNVVVDDKTGSYSLPQKAEFLNKMQLVVFQTLATLVSEHFTKHDPPYIPQVPELPSDLAELAGSKPTVSDGTGLPDLGSGSGLDSGFSPDVGNVSMPVGSSLPPGIGGDLPGSVAPSDSSLLDPTGAPFDPGFTGSGGAGFDPSLAATNLAGVPGLGAGGGGFGAGSSGLNTPGVSAGLGSGLQSGLGSGGVAGAAQAGGLGAQAARGAAGSPMMYPPMAPSGGGASNQDGGGGQSAKFLAEEDFWTVDSGCPPPVIGGR